MGDWRGVIKMLVKVDTSFSCLGKVSVKFKVLETLNNILDILKHIEATKIVCYNFKVVELYRRKSVGSSEKRQCYQFNRR